MRHPFRKIGNTSMRPEVFTSLSVCANVKRNTIFSYQNKFFIRMKELEKLNKVCLLQNKMNLKVLKARVIRKLTSSRFEQCHDLQ